MNMRTLDDLLDRARRAAPMVSVEDTERFLTRALTLQPDSTDPARRRVTRRTRRFITGGIVMTLISGITLTLVLLLQHPDNHVTRASDQKPQASGAQQSSVSSHAVTVSSPQPDSDAATTPGRAHDARMPDAASGHVRGIQHQGDASGRPASGNVSITTMAYVDQLGAASRVTSPNALPGLLTPRPFTLHTAPERIAPLTVYVLDSAELQRIGIVTDGRGNAGWKTGNMKVMISRHGGTMEVSGHPSVSLTQSGSNDSVARSNIGKNEGKRAIDINRPNQRPLWVMITDYLGRKEARVGGQRWSRLSVPSLQGKSPGRDTTQTDTDHDKGAGVIEYQIPEDDARQLRDLVAIRVHVTFRDSTVASQDEFVIYWFERTPALLSALPERIRRELDAEGTSEKSPAGITRDAHPASSSRAFALTYFPHPVTNGSCTIRIDLPAAGHFTIGIYDILGRKLRDLAEGARDGAGRWEQKIDLGDLKPGLYLVAVAGDAGALEIRQLVVEK